MEEEYLIHYRTPGSKNGVRLYQYEDGSLTPAGKRRYLENGGIVRASKSDELPRKLSSRYGRGAKGNIPWVSKEFEEENEYNSRQNEYFKPSKQNSVSGSKRSRVSKDQNRLDEKIEAHSNSFESQYKKKHPSNVHTPDGIYARSPELRKVDRTEAIEIKLGNKFRKFKAKLNFDTYKYIKSYLTKSMDKTVNNALHPPKGSDGINYLKKYITKESNDALTAYMNASVKKDFGSYINSFIQTSQMNIVSGCARFLDSIGLDGEVNALLNYFGKKTK